MKILFLYLKAFSFTGGIEKFNRSFLKALHELSVDGVFDADAFSMHDAETDEKYFPRLRFKGYAGNRLWFVFRTIQQSMKYNTVIIGHINLAIVGYMLKLIKPSIKVVVIAHGIEVWKTHKTYKRKLLEKADLILSVSNFTKQKIVEANPGVNPDRISVFPNTIDPYFAIPKDFDKPAYLLERYNIDPSKKVLITVTRLSFSEKYKGYDNTIRLMKQLSQEYNGIQYLICGKADKEEAARIQQLIKENGVENCIRLTGFVKDEELIDHYKLGDVFVMPSKKEGFGIVFIEALACGRRVIAGSKDGSVDALMNGALGKLVDPDSMEELKVAINDSFRQEHYDSYEMQQKVLNAFGFPRYKERLKHNLVKQ